MIVSKLFTMLLTYKFNENKITVDNFDEACERLERGLHKVFNNDTFRAELGVVDTENSIHVDKQYYPFVDVVALLYTALDDSVYREPMMRDYIDTYAQQVRCAERLVESSEPDLISADDYYDAGLVKRSLY